jgi:hypothetical protein
MGESCSFNQLRAPYFKLKNFKVALFLIHTYLLTLHIQGDQIGRIFAQFAFVDFELFLYDCNSRSNFGLAYFCPRKSIRYIFFIDWATFWTNVSQTNLVTLAGLESRSQFGLNSDKNKSDKKFGQKVWTKTNRTKSLDKNKSDKKFGQKVWTKINRSKNKLDKHKSDKNNLDKNKLNKNKLNKNKLNKNKSDKYKSEKNKLQKKIRTKNSDLRLNENRNNRDLFKMWCPNKNL